MRDILPDEFKTGHDEIDDQHRDFLALSDEIKMCIADKNRKRIKMLYVKLLDHIMNHFIYEELLMYKMGYPMNKLEEHRYRHRELQHLYLECFRPILSDKMELETIIDVFENQFVHHLATMDKDMISFIKSRPPQTLL